MGTSVFEIIGPIMIGPSSSHTAGMARIGMMAHRIVAEKPVCIHLDLSPMMKNTYAGHRSDAALFGGAMGLNESDPSIRNAIVIAKAQGIETSVDFLPEGKYPQNTALLTIKDVNGYVTKIQGTSIGGGSIIISAVDEVPMNISADAFHIILWSKTSLSTILTRGASVQSGTNGNSYIYCFTYTKRPSKTLVSELENIVGVYRISQVEPVLPYGVTLSIEKNYSSCAEVCKVAKEREMTLAEVAIDYEMARSGHTKEEIINQMQMHLKKIQMSVLEGQKENQMLYGLTSGHDGLLLSQAIKDGKTISGGIVPQAVARALGVMEYNASMGCIVAAPTAGSSGIIPGCITTVQEFFSLTDDEIIDALFVASLMGVIMANREVSFSGSVGGCQGEVGVSSCITAAALASLFTKDPETIMHAMAMCLKNLLGLVCDPIAGPIEVPCIKRNAVGVANAFTSADMVLAGIRSYIPPDEVIDALVDVERRLPQELKCATIGGLACTKTACKLREKLKKPM